MIFQLNSKQIEQAFQMQNYCIEYSKCSDAEDQLCAIYFSSNEIYYPNTSAAFQYSILENDKYEWKKNRLLKASKHIFIRDIHKQWYLSGINSILDNPFKLLDFLKIETQGYVINTIGSSAGGYAALLFGSLLNAHKVFAFNAQFNLFAIMKLSNVNKDPILFEKVNDQTYFKYFDLSNILNNNSLYFYFHSANSQLDIDQLNSITPQAKSLLNIIRFNTANHGFPFLRVNLPAIFSFDQTTLIGLANKKLHPMLFSFKLIGVIPTLKFIIVAFKDRFLKKKLEFIHKK